MPRIAIALNNVHPYPTLVVALRRITGRGIGELAAALSLSQPLFDDELLKPPAARQFEIVRQLLTLISVAAVPPVIEEDGRAIDEQRLRDLIENWERASPDLARAPSGAS
jgi:hypothetical protein